MTVARSQKVADGVFVLMISLWPKSGNYRVVCMVSRKVEGPRSVVALEKHSLLLLLKYISCAVALSETTAINSVLHTCQILSAL